jgi:hypothetical protein
MADSEKYRYYLRDLGYLIREHAFETKARVEREARPDRAVRAGYLLGLARVIAIMQQQAEGFGIGLEEIGLEGIDPDNDLLVV